MVSIRHAEIEQSEQVYAHRAIDTALPCYSREADYGSYHWSTHHALPMLHNSRADFTRLFHVRGPDNRSEFTRCIAS